MAEAVSSKIIMNIHMYTNAIAFKQLVEMESARIVEMESESKRTAKYLGTYSV